MNSKKTTSVILILAFSLSLIPNFLYNKGEAFSACPAGCTSEIKDGETYCINCPITCPGTSFTNKSCLPAEGTGEWTLGREIPIGEIIDRSSFLASKMLAEFGGMIESGKKMTEAASQLLTDLPDLSCSNGCRCDEPLRPCLGCFKYFSIFNWELVEGPTDQCADGPQPPGGIPTNRACWEDASQCETCAQCRLSGSCCWETTFPPDPAQPEETITCKYCPQAGSCREDCGVSYCGGCCGQYFSPIIAGFHDIEIAQEDLKNDIDETNAPEKFKRSYILKQLDFARCELAQCWIPAEDYPDILAGEKTGKHLFSCKTVSDMGLFEDDQLVCLVLQVADELEEILELWSNVKHWWDWPVVFFKTVAIAGFNPTTWRTIRGIILEWFDVGKEEGCYPTNYYCGQM